jgi:two-component sensor histidine kinase
MDGFVIKHILDDKKKEEIHFTPLQKEFIFKEIHYRVKDHLNMIASLLGLQLLYTGDEVKSAADVLRHNKLRINIFSLLQELRYQQPDSAGKPPEVYLKNIVSLINDETELSIDVNYHLSPITLAPEEMLLLGTIVAELYTNSLQHACQKEGWCGPVSITLFAKDQKRYLLYREVGHRNVSLQEIVQKPTLGIKLVHMHLKRLDARMQLSCKEDLLFTIIF